MYRLRMSPINGATSDQSTAECEVTPPAPSCSYLSQWDANTVICEAGLAALDR